MKKTIRIVAVVMIIAMISVMFVGCSKRLSGKYSGNLTSYEFKGKNVTRTTEIGGFAKTEEGTYEIVESEGNKDQLVIKLTFGDNTETYDFSQGTVDGVKFIKIGLFEYRQEK